MSRFFGVLCFFGLFSVVPACSLIDTNSLTLRYKFDTLDFEQKIDGQKGTLPSIPCSSDASVCSALNTAVPNATFTCDAATAACMATYQLRLSYDIDLAQQTTFPKEAIMYGVRAVTLDRILYWIRQNTLPVATPKIEVYVGPLAAVDERDARAVLLGTIASLPAGSVSCADEIDPEGDSDAQGAQVCRVPLESAGRGALETFVADYKTPFRLLVHATVTAKAGDPIPSGTIAFSVRPSVKLSVASGQ